MTAALIVLAVVLVAAIGALAFVALRARVSPGPTLASKTVVVHTRDEQSIRGILAAQHSDRLSLRNVIYLHGSGDQPVEGLVHVPTSSVSWLQELSGADGARSSMPKAE
jgi:hypothetical protein